MLRQIAITVLGSLIVLMPAGCGEKAQEKRMEDAIERKTGGEVNVDLSGENVDMKIKTDEGEMTVAGGGGAKLPNDFPKDVHIYGGASVVMAMTQPAGQVVALHTNDPLQKVSATYRKQMEAQGWKEKAATDMGEAVMLSYEKGDRAVILSFTQSDDGTQISISLEK